MMIRLGPLVMVLLAFWLGRETAAERSGKDQGAPANGKFLTLNAKLLRVGMIVVEPIKGQEGTGIRLANGRIFVGGEAKGQSSVEITPQHVVVGSFWGEQLLVSGSEITLREPMSATGKTPKGRFVVKAVNAKQD